jgi:hypothetical protein
MGKNNGQNVTACAHDDSGNSPADHDKEALA